MNIVFVTYHTCARAMKMARALTKAGHQLIVLLHLAASEEILYQLPLTSFYRDRDDLRGKVRMLDEWADLYHVHNEPDWPVWVTADESDRPVVYDCHDLDSQRTGKANEDEIRAFDLVDAAIFPSIAYLNGAKHYHNLKIPLELVLSMCLSEDFAIPMPRVEAIVYEGHHIGPIPGTEFAPGHPLYYGYRDYREFVAMCAGYNIPVAMYGTKAEHKPTYRALGAMVFGMIPYQNMMNDLSKYSWGLCGHPDSHPQWEKAMPNKMFEYLMAGIPIIAWNCEEVEMWIQGYDVGVVVNSYQELREVFEDKDLRFKKAVRVSEIRAAGHFNMEIQTPKILGLYEKVLKRKETA